MKKFTTMAICFVLIACMVAGGSLAYLTDRDSEANVFTVGDVRIELSEDFEQGAKLTPGVDIEKAPKIKNIGINDAWVWMELAIPTALDNPSDASQNAIHWNSLGATWEGVVTGEYIQKAFADGNLTKEMFPNGVTNFTDYITANNMTWDHNNTLVNGSNMYATTINEVGYNVYVIPYNKALEPGETALPSLVKVYMDAHIDIDENGKWYHVEKGEVTPLEWDNTKGAPIIYVSAYGIQAEGFDTVDDAYAAYAEQWGNKGSAITNEGVTYETAGTYNLNEVIVFDNKTKATDVVTAKGENVVVNINGGHYDAANKDCAVWAYNGATVNIYDGYFTCDGMKEATSDNHQDMIYAGSTSGNTTGAINIYGGTFVSDGEAWLLNESDNRGEITVYGGKFINWNPADNVSEGANTNFVASGYKVVETTEGENTVYTVVEEK